MKIVCSTRANPVHEQRRKTFQPRIQLPTPSPRAGQTRRRLSSRPSLYATAPPDAAGTLTGDLIVYGRGDPTINARLNGGSLDAALAPFVAALTNAGIKRITGNLIGDESFYHSPPYGSGWDCDDLQFEYGAELSALTINDNLLKLSVSPGDRIGAPCRLALAPATSYVFRAIAPRPSPKAARAPSGFSVRSARTWCMSSARCRSARRITRTTCRA